VLPSSSLISSRRAAPPSIHGITCVDLGGVTEA